MLRSSLTITCSQVLMDAHQVDMMYDNGTDIRPLCGLTFAVKDLFDVAGYTTVAGTPALAGAQCLFTPRKHTWIGCCTPAQFSCVYAHQRSPFFSIQCSAR